MINDDMRKLLGGYATNTLTEDERKALFEAALEDQELFNAMQEEEALKELLADPVARAQVQRALETKPASKARWWGWSSAIGVAAAGVLIFAVVENQRTQQKPIPAVNSVATRAVPAPEEPPVRVVKPQAEASSGGPVEHAGRQTRPGAVAKQLRMSPALPPAAPAPTAADAVSGQKDEKAAERGVVAGSIGSVQQQAVAVQNSPGGPSQNAQIQAAQNFREQTAAALSANAVLVNSLLTYSFAKRDADGSFLAMPGGTPLAAGDAVQIRVVPMMAGFLALDQVDAPGRLKRVFPPTGPGIAVTAAASVTIPDSAIEVTSGEQRFRLTLTPGQVQVEADAGQKKAEMKARAAPMAAGVGGRLPVSVDVVIGPGVR